MRLIIQITILFLFLFPNQTKKALLIDELFKMEGLDKSINSSYEYLNIGLETAYSSGLDMLPQDVKNFLSHFVKNNFNAELIKSEVKQHLNLIMSTDELQEIIDFNRSELALLIKKSEESFNKRALTIDFRALGEDSFSQERRSILDKHIIDLNQLQKKNKTRLFLTLAKSHIMNAFTRADLRQPHSEFVRIFEKNQLQVGAANDKLSRLFIYAEYQDVPLNELKKYMNIISENPHKKLFTHFNDQVIHSTEQAIIDIGQLLIQVISEKYPERQNLKIYFTE